LNREVLPFRLTRYGAVCKRPCPLQKEGPMWLREEDEDFDDDDDLDDDDDDLDEDDDDDDDDEEWNADD